MFAGASGEQQRMKTVAELMSLAGRRALVTGGTGAIGRVIADTLAELGSEVVLVDRPGSDFTNVENMLRDRWSVKVSHCACDLEEENERKQMLEFIKDEHGALDILVNNAAFVGESDLDGWVTSFEEQSTETWRRAFEVNLTAVFDLCRGCMPLLKKDGKGTIINIASIYGVSAPDYSLYEGTSMGNPAAYAASKGGLLQLTRWLATTLAPEIRVNAVSPGGVFRGQPETFVKRYETRTPAGRMATERRF
jgi:NAD(P)-dependent dehydrogenase (short-subunit alcohol dehydrogenase family)